MNTVAEKLPLPSWFKVPEEWDWDSLIDALCVLEYYNWQFENGSNPNKELPDDEIIQHGAWICFEQDPVMIERRTQINDVTEQMIIHDPEEYDETVNDYVDSVDANDYWALDEYQRYELGLQIINKASGNERNIAEMEAIAEEKGYTISHEYAQDIYNDINWMDMLNEANKDEAVESAPEYVAQNQLATIDGDSERVIIENEAYNLGTGPENINPTRGTWSAVTGLIDEDYQVFSLAGSSTSRGVDELNDIISEQMYLQCTGEEIDEGKLLILESNGLGDIVDFIRSREEGDYYVLTDQVRDDLLNAKLAEADKKTYNEGQRALQLDAEEAARQNANFQSKADAASDVSGYFSSTGIVRFRWQQMGMVNWIVSVKTEIETARAEGREVDENLRIYARAFSYLTEDTVDTLRYYYQTGIETGDYSQYDEFYDLIKSDFNEALYQAEQKSMGVWVDKTGPWGEIASGAMAVRGGVNSPLAIGETLWDAITGQRVDTSSPIQLTARSASDYADIATENMGSFGKKVVKGTIGLIQNVPAIVAYALGQPEIGALYSAVLIAGQDVAQQNRLGASAWEAYGHAAIMGAINYFTTKSMMSGFSKVMSFSAGWATETFVQKIAKLSFNVFGSFGVGFTRSARGVLVSNLADMLIAGDHSRLAFAVAAYQKNGHMNKTEALGAAASDLFLSEPVQTGMETGIVLAGFAVLGTKATPGNPTALEFRQPWTNAKSGFTMQSGLSTLPDGTISPLAGTQSQLALPAYAPTANNTAWLIGTGTASSIPAAQAAADKYIASGMSEPDAVVAAALELYNNSLELPGGNSPELPSVEIEMPRDIAILETTPQVKESVSNTAQEMQTLSEQTLLDLYDEAVNNAYLQFGLNPTNGNALTVYDASLNSLGDAIAQQQAGAIQLPQPQIDAINTQTNVIQGRVNALVTQESAQSLPSGSPAPDVGDLFLEYEKAIGVDNMPSFAEFEQMNKEGGAVWDELTLQAEYKQALKSGEIEPFTSIEEYQAMVDGNVGMGYNETVNVDKFDFGQYLRRKIGNPPADMVDPHAHHILFKKGLGPAQQALVKEGQALLRRYGIDPIWGLENLVWAPNRIVGQHDIVALRNVVEQLKAVEELGGDFDFIRDQLVIELKRLGRLAATRR